MPSRDKLAGFSAWCVKNLAGDEKGEAQISLDGLFQAFGQSGSRLIVFTGIDSNAAAGMLGAWARAICATTSRFSAAIRVSFWLVLEPPC